MWLEKRSRLLKGDFCAVCVRRSAQSTGARSADVSETGELCARLAPATPSDGASAVQDVETEPRARAAADARVSPAGAGKSNLDGMFGRLKKMLDDAVNSGASYWDASTIVEAADAAGGMHATTFLEYTPSRGTKQLSAELPDSAPKVATFTRTR